MRPLAETSRNQLSLAWVELELELELSFWGKKVNALSANAEQSERGRALLLSSQREKRRR